MDPVMASIIRRTLLAAALGALVWAVVIGVAVYGVK
jgi:hypothetical protein